MQQVTIGTKNQIVIPKEVRQKIKGLKPGRKVKIYPLNDTSIVIKLDTRSWIDSSYGLMKKAWNSINPAHELNRIREEWQ